MHLIRLGPEYSVSNILDDSGALRASSPAAGDRRDDPCPKNNSFSSIYYFAEIETSGPLLKAISNPGGWLAGAFGGRWRVN